MATPKQKVKRIFSMAMLDYYESLRRDDVPCWFVRLGIQGSPISDICSTPQKAWRSAFDRLRMKGVLA